jgi:hypothetical protein
MATATEVGKTAQDQILNAYTMASNAIVEGVRNWAEAVDSVTPENFNAPAIPGIENLPSPAEGVEMGFDFAQRVLDTQREFATALIQAMAPAVAKVEPKASQAKATKA